MRTIFLALSVFLASVASADVLRTIDADSLISADKLKSWSLPSYSSQLSANDLGNLAATAINVDLRPASDNTYSLGSSSLRFQTLNALVANDGSGNPSVDFSNRSLKDSGGNITLDWAGRFLYDVNGNTALDFSVGARALYDDNSIETLNFSPSALGIKGDTTGAVARSLLFYDSSNSTYVGLKGADAGSDNTTYVLPLSDGATGNFLTTDGAGNMSWTAGGGGGSTVDVAYQDNSGQSTSTNTWTVLKYNTLVIDANTDYNTSTGVYTAPSTGDYFISASIFTDPVVFTPTSLFGFVIRNNGALVLYSQRNGQDPSNAIAYAVGVSGLVHLTAGDQVTVEVYDTSTATTLSTTTPTGNTFSAHKISGGGGSGANQALSNLTSPTAINQNLYSLTGGSWTIATADAVAADLNISTNANGVADNVNTGSVFINSQAATGTGVSGSVSLTAASAVDGNAGQLSLQGGSTSGTGGAGGVNIVAGGSSGSSGAGGSVTLAAGDSANGTPGTIALNTSNTATSTPGDINITTGINNANVSGNIVIGNGHIRINQEAPSPTISSGCGTSPSLVGNDVLGRITIGSGGIDTTCVIAFTQAFATTPMCFVSPETEVIPLQISPSTTNMTVNSTTPFAAGSTLAYHCLAL